MSKFNLIPVLLVFFLAAAGCAPKQSAEPGKQFTFGWQYSDPADMKPRGGITTGVPVELAASPNPGWLSIQGAGLSKFERDREAILAMAGVYRVTFDFLETVPLRSGYKPGRPYQSWATEYIEVIEDSGKFISLQHILVMYFIGEGGKIEGPMVTKHWRQDWTYEDTAMLEYRGDNTWQTAGVPESESKGKWSQAVYQVDDTPRYESLGEWKFDGNYFYWKSGTTWRPLPRREFTVRDDYNVLSGVNLVTINPAGWVHEQENLKLVVDPYGRPLQKDPYIAKEAGLDRYELITGFDYSAAADYWELTAPFWKDVRDGWAEAISENPTLRLRNSYEGKKLYEYLFEYADGITEASPYDSAKGKEYADTIIGHFVIKSGQPGETTVY